MEEQKNISKKRRLYVPKRLVFTGIRVLIVVTCSLQMNCMSVAITSMVKSSSKNNTIGTTTIMSSDVCPVHVDNGTTANVLNKEGDFDWNEVTQSYVTNGCTYGALGTMLIGAYMAQRWSPKLIIFYASAASAVCTALVPVLAKWSVYALVVARVLTGLPMGLGTPASGQLESSWFPPDERQQLSGIIMSAMGIASIISSSLTGVLVEESGWELVFYVYGGTSVIALILWTILVFDTPEKHPHISDEEKQYITTSVHKITEVKLPIPWVKIAMSLPVWAYLSMSIASAWLIFILMSELPTYLIRMFYYSTSNAGFITSLANAATVFSQIVSGFFSKWLRRKGYIGHLTSYKLFNAVATLGPAASLIAINQIGCNATIVVVLIVFTMFLQGMYISGSMLNYMDLAINYVPTLAAIGGTITGIVGIISPLVTASMINNNQTLSAWSKVFYISAGVTAIPYFIFLLFGSVEEQPWNKPKFDISKDVDEDIEESRSQTKKK